MHLEVKWSGSSQEQLCERVSTSIPLHTKKPLSYKFAAQAKGRLMLIPPAPHRVSVQGTHRYLSVEISVVEMKWQDLRRHWSKCPNELANPAIPLQVFKIERNQGPAAVAAAASPQMYEGALRGSRTQLNSPLPSKCIWIVFLKEYVHKSNLWISPGSCSFQLFCPPPVFARPWLGSVGAFLWTGGSPLMEHVFLASPLLLQSKCSLKCCPRELSSPWATPFIHTHRESSFANIPPFWFSTCASSQEPSPAQNKVWVQEHH